MAKKRLSLLLILTVSLTFSASDFTLFANAENKKTEKLKLNNVENQVEKLQPKDEEIQAEGVIVQLNSDYSDLTKSEKNKVKNLDEGDTLAKDIEAEEVLDFKGEDNTKVVLATSDSLSEKSMIKNLKDKKIVKKVVPNYKRKVFEDDEYFKYQWGSNNVEAGDGHGISVKSEWDGNANIGSTDKVVALIDTGIDTTHPDLQNQLWVNPYRPQLKGKYGYNFIDDNGDLYDDFGHGTFCAGIIGADANGKGVQGVNKKVRIMGLKVGDAEGSLEDIDIISAYNYIYRAVKLGTNVVAVNCSFGGYGYDEILEDIIDLVGEETGVISVCAAGNESTNIDETPCYPACYDSPYIVSVGALAKDGNLAAFSNYGKNNVDIAAPGADILSTANKNTYTPSLYPTDDTKNAKFTNFTDEKWNDVVDLDLTEVDDSKITTSDSGFKRQATDDSACMKIDFTPTEHGQENNDWQAVVMPYTTPSDYDPKKPVNISVMLKNECDHIVSDDDQWNGKYSEIIMSDVPASIFDDTTSEGKEYKKHIISSINSYNNTGTVVSGKDNYWTHFTLSSENSPGFKGNQERAILLIGYGVDDFTTYVDDFGISKSVDNSKFGKYDFSNGTSFSAPYVSGAMALLSDRDKKTAQEYSPNAIINNVLTSNCEMTGTNFDNIASKGTLDLSKKGQGYRVSLGSVKVNPDTNKIVLQGDFDADTLKIKIKKSDLVNYTEVPQTNIEQISKYKILITEPANTHWINNKIDISVEGIKSGQQSITEKKKIYLVKGKKDFEQSAECDIPFNSCKAITSDGTNLYVLDPAWDSVKKFNMKSLTNNYDEYDENNEPEDIFSFDEPTIKKFFKNIYENENKKALCDLQFDDNVVYLDGNLYFVAMYGEATNSGDEFDSYAGNTYFADAKLFKLSVKTSKIEEMSLPTDFYTVTNGNRISRVEDYTIGKYKGNLYLAGGYDYSANNNDGDFSKKAYKFDNSTKKWVKLADEMPEGRAGGKLLQAGDKLVYTLGYTEENKILFDDGNYTTINYIYDGKTWKTSGVFLDIIDYKEVVCGDGKYAALNADVGQCNGGLVYIRGKVWDYGDTFFYDVNNERYKDTGFAFSKTIDEGNDNIIDMGWIIIGFGDEDNSGEAVIATTVDNDIVVFDNSESCVYKAKNVIKSATLDMKVSLPNKYKKCAKVLGAGKYMPGDYYTLRIACNPGYYATSLKALSGTSPAATFVDRGLTVRGLVESSKTFAANIAKIRIKGAKKILAIKAGKAAKIRTRVYPATAARQWKLSYKTSKKKYATVNAKGVVKAQKAGKRKTVIISTLLKGTKTVISKTKIVIK